MLSQLVDEMPQLLCILENLGGISNISLAKTFLIATERTARCVWPRRRCVLQAARCHTVTAVTVTVTRVHAQEVQNQKYPARQHKRKRCMEERELCRLYFINSPKSDDVCQPSSFDVFLKFPVKFFCGPDFTQTISVFFSAAPYGASNLGTRQIGSHK